MFEVISGGFLGVFFVLILNLYHNLYLKKKSDIRLDPEFLMKVSFQMSKLRILSVTLSELSKDFSGKTLINPYSEFGSLTVKQLKVDNTYLRIRLSYGEKLVVEKISIKEILSDTIKFQLLDTTSEYQNIKMISEHYPYELAQTLLGVETTHNGRWFLNSFIKEID